MDFFVGEVGFVVVVSAQEQCERDSSTLLIHLGRTRGAVPWLRTISVKHALVMVLASQNFLEASR